MKNIRLKTPEEAVSTSARVMAQVMDIGEFADVQALAAEPGDAVLCDVLRHAEAGQFSPRSWAYWHCRLGLSLVGQVPALPSRTLA